MAKSKSYDKTPLRSKYPEHEKLGAIKDKSQAIGAFLDWLGADRGIQLSKPHQHTHGCYSGNHRLCDYNRMELEPVSLPIQEVLAEYFGINLNKIEQEKRQILAAVMTAPPSPASQSPEVSK